MSNIVCYSPDGSVLEYLNQWSTNQKLIIRGADVSAAPVFYFYNAKIKEALAVSSEIVNNDLIVTIPDIMLQYEFPIIIDVDYSFSISADFTIRIPIMPKAKPGDYIFDGTGGSGGSQKPSIEIVNNLTTDSPVAALSAAQGVVLKSMIDDVALNIDVEDQINEALEAAKDRGDFDGTGIVSVLRTEGSGQPGTTDTYTITFSDGSTSFFTVYNGKDGVNIEVDDDNNVPLDVFIELQNRINDMQIQIGTTPVSEQIQSAIDNSNHITEAVVDEKIALLVDSAPETLNTLNELSEALGDDPNFATSIINQLGSKVDKADGMGLSSNDYTDDDKNMLLSINERVGSVSVADQINNAWNEHKDDINADMVDGMHAADFASASSVSELSNKIGNESIQTQINTAFSKIQTKAGFIYPLAGETVPDGFLLCDGKAYSRAEYPELFAVIGTFYGAGNGSTTFNVPNLSTRVPVGAGTGYTLGATGGESSVKLKSINIPQINVWSDMYGESAVLGHKVSESSNVTHPGFAPVDGFTGGENYNRSYTVSAGSKNNTAHNNMQPYTVVNYIIATGKGTGVSVQNVIMGAQALPLGVEYGGTGATNIQNARSNLGLGNVSIENIVPIEKGGTGATSASQAIKSLGAAPAKIYRCGAPTGDLNNLVSPGWYWIRCVDCTNTPRGDNVTGAYAYLEVVTSFDTDTNVLQRYTQYPDGKTWIRSSVNGWQPWVRIDSIDKAPMYQYSTADLTAGSSALETGKLYFVYE